MTQDKTYTLPENLLRAALQCISAQPAGQPLNVANAHGEPLLVGSLLHELQTLAREQDSARAKAQAAAEHQALREQIAAELKPAAASETAGAAGG